MMGFGVIGLLLMLLFWGGLIVLAVWLVKTLFQGDRGSPAPPPARAKTAREILDERYARGEITREQYELIQQDIS
jgi:putative membrane protein